MAELRRKCAPGLEEHTLCGTAPECSSEEADEFGSRDYDSPDFDWEFAKRGDRVTCPDCLRLIAYCKQFRYNRVPDDVPKGATQ